MRGCSSAAGKFFAAGVIGLLLLHNLAGCGKGPAKKETPEEAERRQALAQAAQDATFAQTAADQSDLDKALGEARRIRTPEIRSAALKAIAERFYSAGRRTEAFHIANSVPDGGGKEICGRVIDGLIAEGKADEALEVIKALHLRSDGAAYAVRLFPIFMEKEDWLRARNAIFILSGKERRESFRAAIEKLDAKNLAAIEIDRAIGNIGTGKYRVIVAIRWMEMGEEEKAVKAANGCKSPSMMKTCMAEIWAVGVKNSVAKEDAKRAGEYRDKIQELINNAKTGTNAAVRELWGFDADRVEKLLMDSDAAIKTKWP